MRDTENVLLESRQSRVWQRRGRWVEEQPKACVSPPSLWAVPQFRALCVLAPQSWIKNRSCVGAWPLQGRQTTQQELMQADQRSGRRKKMRVALPEPRGFQTRPCCPRSCSGPHRQVSFLSCLHPAHLCKSLSGICTSDSGDEPPLCWNVRASFLGSAHGFGLSLTHFPLWSFSFVIPILSLKRILIRLSSQGLDATGNLGT